MADKTASPERRLWQSVLILALIDLRREEAIRWLASTWGRQVADMAGVNPSWAIRSLTDRDDDDLPRSFRLPGTTHRAEITRRHRQRKELA
ncbi:MAG: hypothetical protein QNJ13_17415 [Paracoccaceae bacterium]|nr:hypothetical protein [Paracoccaceae bacterium]